MLHVQVLFIFVLSLSQSLFLFGLLFKRHTHTCIHTHTHRHSHMHAINGLDSDHIFRSAVLCRNSEMSIGLVKIVETHERVF